jgi:hypothetical protein
MRNRCTVAIALALALALWGCGGDDDDASSDTGNDPFGNTNGIHDPASGNSNSVGGGGRTSTGTGTGGTGSTDAGAGPAMHMGDPGMMMMPGMMKPPMMPMEMCPATKPEDGSACMGHQKCTFDGVECRCKEEAWSCGNHDMKPDEDGGAMLP